jgi:enoyl-CoA hydratase
MADPVLLEVKDRAAVVTLNRPERRNALNSETLRLLPELVAQADGDDAVDSIILTGADPAFCAGLDLKELGDSGDNFRAGNADGADTTRRGPLPSTTKPLIGAVNGPAATGGLELALVCDFLIASENARFADTHARVGLHPGWGLSVLLPQAVGIRRAREMSAAGRFVDAPTALAWGLVNHVVPHEELLPFCLALAAEISSADQSAVRRLYDTYDKVAGEEAGWAAEREGAVAWMKEAGFDPSRVAERRDAIINRGSNQV